MFLEAFFSTVASTVFTEIFKRVTNSKSLKEEDIERIIDKALQRHHLVGQTSLIEREIIMVLGSVGLPVSGGQLLLPTSHRLPDLPELLGAWWDNRIYKIVSVYSEKVLDVPNTRTEDGVPIQLRGYHGGANQQWKVIPVGDQDNLFKIYSLYSARVLDVPEPRMDDGTPIIQWGYQGGTNQQWRLLPIDKNGEIFKITSEWSGKSLDAPSTRTDDGTPIIQWGYQGGTNQQWRLMRVKYS